MFFLFFFDGKDQRVKVTRYFLCGFFSILLHGLTLSAKPVEKINMPYEDVPTSLNLQLMSFAAPTVQRAQDLPEPQTKTQEKILEQTPSIDAIPKPSLLPKVEKTPVKKENKPKEPKTEKITKQDLTQKTVTKQSVKQQIEPNKTPVKKSETEKTTKEVPQAPDKAQADNTQPASSARPLITKPTFKVQPKYPPYPRNARRRGLEGTVILEVWLDKHGEKEKVRVLTSSGHAILDDAALKAVNQWQFKHYEVQGKASASRLHIPIRFNLD